MISFIGKWGYVGVFIGSLFEGESIILSISSMAYYGKFSLSKIIFICAIGTIMAQQLIFHLGRATGKKLLHRYPSIEKKADKIFFLLKRYDIFFIMGSRFVYGIRTISPFFIGLSNISIFKFSFWNVISGLVWSVSICVLGYYIGAFGSLIGQDHWYISLIFNFLITAILIIIFHFLSKKFSGNHHK